MSKEQETAARDFASFWNGHGDEERDTQKFWFALLRDVFGVDKPERIIEPEFPVQFEEATGYIDILIPSTKVLIEQKSFGVDLSKKYPQSDGELLSPFDQAKRYAEAMPFSTRPRWIVTCNFNEFRIYDLAEMNLLDYLEGTKVYKPTIVKLEELQHACSSLEFLVDPNAKLRPEVKISIDAAKIVLKICKAIDPNYLKRDAVYIDALSKLCARLVFCFYADDEKLFTQTKFGDWLKNIPAENLRDALQIFFDVLNMTEAERPENLDAELKKFPCVDGGLFDEKLDMPPLNEGFLFAVERAHIYDDFQVDELGNLLKFSWREISPPIFGAMFESVFNLDTRRTGGIHYTSVENIHKVIDPLFFDELSDELSAIKRMYKENRVAALKKFQDKLASLTFLDPACGSGNFLTETYLSLRRLENEALAELRRLHAEIPDDPIKVAPKQFFGIEINDFAVAVAKDALWISEIQMLRKTSWIIARELPELPLRKNISVQKANALRVDWKEIFGEYAPEKFDYIIGNPPFIGYSNQTPAQKDDIRAVYSESRRAGKIDYVAAWYKKAVEFIQGTKTRCAFVSTNSITQGEQVADVWKILFERLGVHIDFAYKPFKWLSDSEFMAHVHCVIVAFSVAKNNKPKIIFDGENATFAENINPYLIDGENIFVESRREPIQADVPEMIYGNKPADGGNLIVETVPKINKGSQPTDGGNLIIEANDYESFLREEPAAEKYIRPFLGAEEFINGKKRYCLWLVDVPDSEIEKMPLVADRVKAVQKFRSTSKKTKTREDADAPTLFQEIRQPTTDYIFIPRHSSESRQYIPIGFLSPNVIAGDAALIIPDATTYDFGILTSSIHMAWMRIIAGRLEIDYRYSAQIVYNNFPWPKPTADGREWIELTAQKILDVRKKFSDWSFAKLYDEETMPKELYDAHLMNDTAVALAYGFEKFLHDEPRIVAELMKLYAELTKS